MNVNIYKSSEECNSRLAEYLIENYLSKNKNIAISGGSTPVSYTHLTLPTNREV